MVKIALLSAVLLFGGTATPPLKQDRLATCSGVGICRACKNCKYCTRCSVAGLKCSVCRRSNHHD